MDLKIAKWYLDCVADDGETFIGYAARIHWRGVSVGYANSLHLRPGHDVMARSTLRNVKAPVTDAGVWTWASPGLAVEGRWTPREAGLDEVLHEDADTRVAWRCPAPSADVAITLDGREIRGTGYVERVEVDGTPRHLPLHELWWGRFHAPHTSLVWIEWRGPHPLQRVFLDGRSVRAEIDVDYVGVANAGVRLDLDAGRVVREGPIASTVLRAIPVFLGMLPRYVLETHERKVVSRGVLSRADGTIRKGFAIHEIVRFGVESPGTDRP